MGGIKIYLEINLPGVMKGSNSMKVDNNRTKVICRPFHYFINRKYFYG